VNYRIQKRNVWGMSALYLVTLGLYVCYLHYQWARDFNHLCKRQKYNPRVWTVIGVLTCGVGFIAWSVQYAFELERIAESRNVAGRTSGLGVSVLLFPLVSISLATVTGGSSAVVSAALGLLPAWLMQRELNKLSDHEFRDRMAALG